MAPETRYGGTVVGGVAGAAALAAFVWSVSGEEFPVLLGLVEERRYRETIAAMAAPPAPGNGRLYDTKYAAGYLGCHEDEIRDRARRRTLAGTQERRGARWHFTQAALDDYTARHTPRLLDGIVDQRYSAPHDTQRRVVPPTPAPHDTTRARDGARRHADDRRPLGARRAIRHAAGRDEPYTPGQAAWALPHPHPPATRPESES